MTNEDGTEATADSPENVEALELRASACCDDGVAAYSSRPRRRMGRRGVRQGLSAMTIEGNWIGGAMNADFPTSTTRWPSCRRVRPGRAPWRSPTAGASREASGDKEDAVDLVAALTSGEQQLAFADAFGVMPSVESASRPVPAGPPDYAAFVAGADYAQNRALPAGRC